MQSLSVGPEQVKQHYAQSKLIIIHTITCNFLFVFKLIRIYASCTFLSFIESVSTD